MNVEKKKKKQQQKKKKKQNFLDVLLQSCSRRMNLSAQRQVKNRKAGALPSSVLRCMTRSSIW